jgi:hypothetical protein
MEPDVFTAIIDALAAALTAAGTDTRRIAQALDVAGAAAERAQAPWGWGYGPAQLDLPGDLATMAAPAADEHGVVRLHGRRVAVLRAEYDFSVTVEGQEPGTRWSGYILAPQAEANRRKAERETRAARQESYAADLADARASVAAMSAADRETLALAVEGYGLAECSRDHDWGRCTCHDHLAPCGWWYNPGQEGGTLADETRRVSARGALRPWAAEWGPAVESARAEYQRTAEERAQAEREADAQRSQPVCPAGMGDGY